jgi:quercetin dioxygenase-like cupin family protein
MYVIHQSQLPFAGMSHEFVGMDHGGVGVSFFVVIGEPGRGTALHKHDYDEVVYVNRRPLKMESWRSGA